MILDANALLHRAWHALPPLTNPEGVVVNAVYGVTMVVLKLLQDRQPDAFVACWDTKEPTFRHEAFAAYKAQREKQPDELYEQIPLLKEGLNLLGIASVEKDGYEADDLIGTIATRSKQDGWEVTIVTGDRDALQLVQQDITVLAFKKGVSETIVFDEEEVKRQYGLTPAQFLTYKAMRGDPSDNIPGIRGIGEKGATELLKIYGDLHGIFRAAHDPSSSLSSPVRSKLLAAEHDMPAILALVTIRLDAPIGWRVKDYARRETDIPRLREFCLRMGFKSLLVRIEQMVTTGSQTSPKEQNTNKMEDRARLSVCVRLQNVEEAVHAADDIRKDKEVVVRVARGVAGSLFANAVDGVVLGMVRRQYFFSAKLLKDDAVRKAVVSVLSEKNIGKIAHDAKAEQTLMESLGLVVNGWTFDVMIAAYLLGAGERNHDLPMLVQQRLFIAPSAEWSTFDETSLILRLTPVLRAELLREHLMGVFERFELPLIPVLREMEKNGIKIDRPYFAVLAEEMRRDKDALEKKMMKIVGKEFNPASPLQLGEILFSHLGLPTKGIKKGKTGFSTAASELEKLHGIHPIIEAIEEHRELSKLLSTYVDVMPAIADASGRVHTTFHQVVTATGRLSSSDPNMQNIPIRSELGRKIRRGFIAEKGFVLLSCDYSQIELRIVASLAKDEEMLEAFRRHEDIHTATAAAIFGTSKEQVTKDQRRAAKAVNFGVIYGQGPMGLAAGAGMTFQEAKRFISTYFDVYRGIKRYMEETKTLAAKNGYVETAFGRRRPLPEIHSLLPQVKSQAERMAINMPVQGTAADLMKLAMIVVYQRLTEVSSRARMLLQVHDELLLEVPEKEVADVARFVRETMEHVERMDVPIIVDAKAGIHWEEMTPITS